MRFDGKAAIVTGAGQGIGRAIALSLAKEGAAVALADIVAERAKSAVAEIEHHGGRAMAVKVDVTKRQEVNQMVQEVLKAFGKVDILVNNVGLSTLQSFMENTEDYWDEIIAINLKGVILCSRAALDDMIKRKYGKIVNITSTAGIRGAPGQVVYSATKAGVIGFTRALAREVVSFNINVNCVAPGPTDTPLWKRAVQERPDLTDTIKATVPMGRAGLPEEVAASVLFLASDEAGWMVGQTLSASGGFVML